MDRLIQVYLWTFSSSEDQLSVPGGCHGYSPEHLGELSLAERHDDGETDAGGDEVEQGGLRRERESQEPGSTETVRFHGSDDASRPSEHLAPPPTCACLKVCMTKMVRPRPKM